VYSSSYHSFIDIGNLSRLFCENVGSLKKVHGGKLEGKDGGRGGLLATVILDRIKERRGVWRKKAYPNYPDPELMNWSSELFRVTSI
jgi:hypothetical protein